MYLHVRGNLEQLLKINLACEHDNGMEYRTFQSRGFACKSQLVYVISTYALRENLHKAQDLKVIHLVLSFRHLWAGVNQ